MSVCVCVGNIRLVAAQRLNTKLITTEDHRNKMDEDEDEDINMKQTLPVHDPASCRDAWQRPTTPLSTNTDCKRFCNLLLATFLISIHM